MPDLNLRRIVLLRLADGLCRLAGHDPKVDLVRRADALKALCRREQWDAEQRWFVGRCANGKRTTRWTIQMFKALEGVKLAGRTFSVRCSRKEGTKVLGLEPKR